MNPIDEARCKDVIIRVSHALDFGQYELLATLFTEDGVWHRQGERLEGRAAIVAVLRNRPPQLVTRHVITNTIVDRRDEHSATVRSVLLGFRHEGDEGKAAFPASFPRSVIDYEDLLVEQGECDPLAEDCCRRSHEDGMR